jgi:glycosyltransferase involved in cell wall biosynthesis
MSVAIEPYRALTGAADRSPPPVLTVLIPVYNEVGTLDELLRRVLAVPCDKQVVVVNDGSTDGSDVVLRGWANCSRIEVWEHERNRGKGAAIRTGLARARGRYTIIQDADLEYDPADYPTLLEPLLTGRAEVVYGSRYLGHSGWAVRRGALLRWGVGGLNLCVRLLYGKCVTDEATCYKVFPTALLHSLDLQSEGFDFCPEVTAKVCRLGIGIYEVPIRYRPRTRTEGKKLRIRDGWAALRALWRWRTWHCDRIAR